MTRREFLVGTALGAVTVFGDEPMSASERPLVRFGLVTDSHSGDLDSTRPPHEIRAFRESLAKMRECVDVMNARKVDFLVELGDFVEWHPRHDDRVKALDAIEAVFSQFRGPRYHVLGNHDLQSLTREEFNAHVTSTGIPKDRTYYSFVRGGVTFVALDHGYFADGTAMGPGRTDWEKGRLSPAERTWLEQTVAAAKGPVVTLSHWRLDPEGRDGLQALDSAETRALFRQHPGKVLASFNGHHHYGSMVVSEHVLYYGLRAMITGNGAEMSGYAEATVYDSGRVCVKGFRRAQSVDLRLTIAHPKG